MSVTEPSPHCPAIPHDDMSSSVGSHISSLSSPALVVDLAAVEKNCDEMLARAAEAGIKLRGQTKTHKTVEGALLQTGGTKRYKET